jgi:hypothetical protein
MIKVIIIIFRYINLFEVLDINPKYYDPLFDTSNEFEKELFSLIIFFYLVAAQEYVLLCCQSNQTGGFTDRPKANARYKKINFIDLFF